MLHRYKYAILGGVLVIQMCFTSSKPCASTQCCWTQQAFGNRVFARVSAAHLSSLFEPPRSVSEI